MTGQITPAMRAAWKVARAAYEAPASAYGPVDSIVVALDSAQLLQSPETAADLVRLRQERAALNEVLAGCDQERGLLTARLAELAPYEELHPQCCEAGQHRGWFADSEGPLPCPWCEIARMQAGRGEVYRAERDGVELATYAVMQEAGAHCESVLRAQRPGAASEWIARGDDSGTLDLITHHDGHTAATGLAVVLVQVYAAFDTAADAAPAVTA